MKKLRKARERLQARQQDYQKTIASVRYPLAFKRPGSLKKKKR